VEAAVSSSVDWGREWFDSLVWIGGVFVASVLGVALVGWLLTRSTAWGRQFRRLAVPYFRPRRDRRSWRPLGIALLVLVLTIAAVRISVLLTYALNGLFTAMQMLDARSFALFLGIFGALAARAAGQPAHRAGLSRATRSFPHRPAGSARRRPLGGGSGIGRLEQ
jgi:putative ATP-binding cassette transporter